MTQKRAQLMVPPAGAEIGAVKAGDGIAIGLDGTICATTGGVTQIVAGSNIYLSPPEGTGVVTVNAVNTPDPAFCRNLLCHNIWSFDSRDPYPAYNNFFAGICAGDNTTGSLTYGNNFIGYTTGRYNTTGYLNNFLGWAAGYYNTTGINNFFAGIFAGCSNTTGSENIFIGPAAGRGGPGGSHNTFIGTSAACTYAGCYNHALGYVAGYASGGNHNIFMGTCSAYCATGNDNIYIGRKAGAFGYSASNSIAIGCYAGFNGTYTGPSSNSIYLGNNNHTNAFIKINWTITSDERDKTCITPLQHGANFLSQIRPVQFQWKDRETNEVTDEQPRYGFLAQQVLSAEGRPTVLVDDHDPENLKLRESMFIPILVNALNELNEKYNQLAEELAALKSQLN